MRLFEYQAKDVFRENGINVPASVLVTDPGQAEQALLEVGLPCVIKCQVLSGGRGKKGLVKKAVQMQEGIGLIAAYFESIPHLHAVLVEEAVPFEREIYLAVLMDAAAGKALLIGSAEGGMDIEQIARENPESIHRLGIDLILGLRSFEISDFVYRLGLRGQAFKQVKALTASLYGVFRKMDAELAEINPLFITAQGTAVAGDGKLMLDDNAMFRHPEYVKGREHYHSDMEYEAAQEGIPYLEFEGDISLMCAGAGLANTVYDLVHFEGGKVSNYLEFGGPNYMKADIAMRLCLGNKPRVILIVTFGTIARADVMAEGIVRAIQELKPDCPIVACLRGTGEERVDEIFAPVGLKRETDTEEAVRKAVAIAAERSRK